MKSGLLALVTASATWAPVALAQTPPAPAPGATGQPGQPPAAARSAPVTVGKAERKAMPFRFDTIGTVQTVASVTVRSRVESQIVAVPFEDGASVKIGDVLFQLDSRQTEALIRQAEANLVRSRAQLDQAQRDVKRNEQLAAQEYASRQKLEDSRTAVQTISAQIQAEEAALDNLKVQLTYYTLRAPIAGRVGVAGLKAGNIAKTGEAAVALATINQTSPIYVAFSMPQRLLPELRQAMTSGTAVVQATLQGSKSGSEGRIAVVDNAVDATTGTITVRGVFENLDETLWPGALCNVRVTLRMQPDAVVVPREAVQTSQTGTFVFVVADNVAKVRPVKVDRFIDSSTVIASGLDGDETVVLDGHLLLTDGTRVEPRGRARPQAPAAGAGAKVDGAPAPAKGAS